MNELKRNGKRTREQLTFSDTYLVLDNLRNYDFDLVSFYVTFNQYIDRRNYQEEVENSLIFKNNESLFKAFNVSRNRFYRLLKLAYECGLVDIEKGTHNRNIYILNDTIPLKPLEKIREWKNREGKEDTIEESEVTNENKEDIIEEILTEENEKNVQEEIDENTSEEEEFDVESYPDLGQPKIGQPVILEKDNVLSQKRITSYPEKGQSSSLIFPDDFNGLDSLNNTPNNSNGLIDLSFNNSNLYNQSISQSIDSKTYIEKKIDRQIDISKQLVNKYNTIINNCEIDSVDEKYRDAVIHAIKLLFLDIENKKRIKIGDNMIPVDIVKEDMEKLNFFAIEHAINKFKKASKEREIRNTIAYLKACIYNSIHEMKLDIDSELRNEGVI